MPQIYKIGIVVKELFTLVHSNDRGYLQGHILRELLNAKISRDIC